MINTLKVKFAAFLVCKQQSGGDVSYLNLNLILDRNFSNVDV